ncbi:acetyl-CoA carboxylase biotin carboxyl carrier protein [Gammaproteobacteria bacterium]|mgnify:FL=1|jgi:acetyl-CoA carboxylase biotin carboxyl carrier protein|nr:acetyl-CoA carboxylase biotin carboxyl carrier protein [Gammaproteobacteria bacterium]MDA9143675.1 acetyl-CoA carboxylase biotin carboxyl carrier protein [Gammaproteobacteria bacterium]MDA9997442.1 acetyl-CoA carboxylase biotin carboxyl carrier protein [Gammaproteobacteria bacterium]MDC0367486.1 acetyl-CoA carboxylase biotin carboxyl carrier protein [Gammaproteobacteria bacterium]MDC1123511.1 acetyl-CoA carboxylase biotin carboxyl carrier protein [Gammaproteobacteria bacterium]
MDIRKIKKLIEMLQESDLTEIEVGQGDESVRIKRGGASQILTTTPSSNQYTADVQVAPQQLTPQVETVSGHTVKSPIVGTFYRRPGPDKNPFIKVGDAVEVGDVLCIIEAMKMMNEIKSEYSGKITAINAEDGDPIEFDQHIITIE